MISLLTCMVIRGNFNMTVNAVKPLEVVPEGLCLFRFFVFKEELELKKWSGISAMVLAAAIIISGCGNLQAASTPASPAENKIFSTAKVTGVVDGDTIKVELEGKEETVRMILVDTPETVHPNKPVQPFGPEASALAKKNAGRQGGQAGTRCFPAGPVRTHSGLRICRRSNVQ